jgi:hypothetical protein
MRRMKKAEVDFLTDTEGRIIKVVRVKQKK